MSYYIRGNKERGAEVIALLESKGGINREMWFGNSSDTYYYIDKYDIIRAVITPENKKIIEQIYEELTLPEPKWEPKRGDVVLVKHYNAEIWQEAIFSFIKDNQYYTQGGCIWYFCIPFDIDKLGKVTE